MTTSIEWFNASKSIIMVVVVAATSYWTVDRSTQKLKESELSLEQARFSSDIQKQKEDRNYNIRKDYLNKAIEATSDIIRLRYLRYLSSTEKDKDFRNWAKNELNIVEEQISDMKKQRDEAIAKATNLSTELIEAEKRRKAAESLAKEAEEKLSLASSRQEKTKAEEELATAKTELENATKSATEAKAGLETAQMTIAATTRSFICSYKIDKITPDTKVFEAYLWVDAQNQSTAEQICKELVEYACEGEICTFAKANPI